MPVPSVIGDLSTTAGSNYPAGTESPTTIDDYFRAHAAFIAQLRDGKVATTGNETIAGTKTFSSTIVGSVSGSAATATSATSATTATTATNIAGGSNGSVPYQSGSGATALLAPGTSGYLLQTNGAGAPSWVNPATLSVASASTATTATSASTATTATNVSGTVAIANGGTGQTTAANAFAALKQDATTSATGVVELATSAEVQAGTDTTRAVTPSGMQAAKLLLGTAQNTTSGTSLDFTSIPSWVKRITVMFNGFSTNGTSSPIVQLGSGSIDASGYSTATGSNDGVNVAASTYTTGFSILSGTGSAAYTYYGSVVLTLMGSNTWTAHGVLALPNVAVLYVGGSKQLGGTLDQVRITTVSGADTFDAGVVNVMWE